MKIQVDENISLDMLEENQASSLLNLINANRRYLRTWLPWVDHMHTPANAEYHIRDTKKRAADKTDFGYAIFIDNQIAGKIGLHHISHQNRVAEIGYWLAGGLQGKGIMNNCCKAIINHAFKELGLNRIEIKCGIENEKSCAIPEKLQFKQEGILRQAELLNGKFIDLYLYAMLKEDWQNFNA
jgi:ribosomal-protein-serine acetyltransferase